MKFEIGDIVKVVDSGYNYPDFFLAMKQLKIKSRPGFFNSNYSHHNFEILSRITHPHCKDIIIYGIEDMVNGHQYIISEKGLEIAKSPDFFSKNDFAI